MTETNISREKALAILTSLGREDEYDSCQDYYLGTDQAGEEFLTEYGYDEPTAQNHGTTSWASPGYP